MTGTWKSTVLGKDANRDEDVRGLWLGQVGQAEVCWELILRLTV